VAPVWAAGHGVGPRWPVLRERLAQRGAEFTGPLP
jgi:hypothetical protein